MSTRRRFLSQLLAAPAAGQVLSVPGSSVLPASGGIGCNSCSIAPPAATAPAGGIVQSGLISEYRFEETGGATLHDSHGSYDGATGSVFGAPPAFATIGGTTALDFESQSEGGLVDFAADAFGSDWSNWTVETWLYVPAIPYNVIGFFSLVDPSGNGLNLIIYKQSGKLFLSVSHGDGGVTSADAVGWTFTGSAAWMHWAISRTQGSPPAFYRNGSPLGVSFNEMTTGALTVASSLRAISYNFNGVGCGYSMGRLHVYNAPLSAADILSNFNACKARFGVA